MPSLPPQEVTKLMQFIANKTKNVTSPMNVMELCRQFKEETGSTMAVKSLAGRIDTYRLKIHVMTEFDTETKVKMLFALRAPIDPGFLSELKKVADVEVDDKQRIIHYKQKDGELELGAKHLRVSIDQGEQRDREIIRFLAEKSKTTETPIFDRVFLREFKANTGCPDSIDTLVHRYRRVKKTICKSSEIDKNTRIKMMFISNAKLLDNVLVELQKDAEVEVDEKGRITKYRAIDGSLKLEGDHSLSAIIEAERVENNKLITAILKRKRAREISENDESLEVQDDSEMNFDAYNPGDLYHYQANYEEDMNFIPLETKPESLLEVKIEVPECQSTSIDGDHNFFDYDSPNNKEDMDNIPVERKPESLIEVKAEVPEEPSTSNSEYHYEENLDQILIKPKPEVG